MHAQQCRGGKRRHPAARQTQRQMKEQDDVEHVQQHVGDVEAEWRRSPERTVDRVRDVDNRTLDVVQQHRAKIRPALNRRVRDDRTVVVVHERIVERVQIHETGKKRRDAGCDQGAQIEWHQTVVMYAESVPRRSRGQEV
jgi:hypothetical protein